MKKTKKINRKKLLATLIAIIKSEIFKEVVIVIATTLAADHTACSLMVGLLPHIVLALLSFAKR